MSHPLGGCTVGVDRDSGTIDSFGRVFDGSAPGNTDTLPGLCVVDGAAIPGALGVNPTLTIVTQARRTIGKALEQ